MPTIKITITKADKQLSDEITSSISDGKGYKYTYLKQLISRIRMAKNEMANLPEEEQAMKLTNLFIVERNIASFSAEQYAELNNEELFNAFGEVVDAIESLFQE
jgi:hypothetical protein